MAIKSSNGDYEPNVSPVPLPDFVPGKDGPQEPNGYVSSDIRKLCYAQDGMKYESHISADQIPEYVSILENTPHDQDPVLYWHQVAIDAIRAQEAAQKRAKRADCLRERAERELNTMTSGLVARTADKRALIPLDMSRLIDMAKFGYIDLDVAISIKRGKGECDHGNEENK